MMVETQMRNLRYFVSIFLVIILSLGIFHIALAGNSFIIGDLRVDLPEVYNARDYRVHIAPGGLPTTGDNRDSTTA